MKNKIIYLFCVIAGLLQGCVQDVDDVFDASASDRMNQALKEYRTLLSSSEQGWLMEYYPSDIKEYGGYALTMKFDAKDNVTMGGVISENSQEAVSSLYSLKSDMGPTLNFDTYNTVIHYFSDPDSDLGAGKGKAFEGDFEFIFQSHSQDTILLKGKKTKNFIRMIRLTQSSSDYLAGAIKVGREIDGLKGVLGFSTTIGGKELVADFVYARRFTMTYGDEKIDAPFMCTTTGIQLYEPVTVGGKTLYRLNWSGEQSTLTAENDPGIVFTANHDPEYPAFAQYLGTYKMNFTGYSGKKSIPVELVQKVYKQSYTIKGMLPGIDVIMIYNAEEQRMELLNQSVKNGSGAFLSPWNVSPGNLEFGGAEFAKGLYSVLKEGTTNTYEFKGTAKIGDALIRAIILWSSAGEYRALGESRFADITMVKD